MSTITRYIDLTALGLLQISGTQSAEFLQGQLSCDVAEITPTQSRLGVHCNAKGRALATFRLFYRAPHYYLLLPYFMADWLLKDLSKYSPFYKVTLENKSETFQKIGLMGPVISRDLAGYGATFKFEENEVYTDDTITLLSIAGILPRAILLSQGVTLNEKIPVQRDSFAHWEVADIKAGIASVYPETREVFTPHHLNYHKRDGISFTKGCYTGQEVIARMHYLGKLKQQVYQFELNSLTPPTPGSDITDAVKGVQGTLIMAASSNITVSTYQALGVIQSAKVSEELYCEDSLLQKINKTKD